jgi:hypothetical protein
MMPRSRRRQIGGDYPSFAMGLPIFRFIWISPAICGLRAFAIRCKRSGAPPYLAELTGNPYAQSNRRLQ